MIEPKSIFSVSLKENLETLRSSICRFLKYYPSSTYYLVSRKEDIDYFFANLHFGERLVIINENELISYEEFSQLYKQMSLANFNDDSEGRLPWYYQQILKIIFALQNKSTEHYPIVMFDADSVPLKKIQFFHDANHSSLFGSLSECHNDYFVTLENIFGFFKYPALGFTTQFFSVTLAEASYLRELLESAHVKTQSLGVLIAQVVLGAVLNAHGTIQGSKFSEQELFGVSNQALSEFSGSTQRPILSFRSWVLTGALTPLQMRLLAVFGVKLLTYENRQKLGSNKLKTIEFMRAFAGDMKPQIIRYLRYLSGSYLNGR